jgi:hypothetical protein
MLGCNIIVAVQRAVSTIVAQDKLARECGFEAVVPRMWIGPVNALAPDGTYVSWDALWMEEASGISLDALTFGGGRNIKTNATEMVNRKLVEELLLTR